LLAKEEGRQRAKDMNLVMVLIPKRLSAIVDEVAGLKASSGINANGTGLSSSQLSEARSFLAVEPLSGYLVDNQLLFRGGIYGLQFEATGHL
jgi:hypothetical protein